MSTCNRDAILRLKVGLIQVNKVSLDNRLRAKRIPRVARKWIASFMSGRHASMGFDDYRTEMAPLANAGLAQGSPLSLFYSHSSTPTSLINPSTFMAGRQPSLTITSAGK